MRLRIGGRLYSLVVLFGIGCVALAATLIWLHGQRAFEARQRALEQIVDSSTGVLEAYRKLAESGGMSVDDAKKRAFKVMTTMRYGQGDYVFLLDMNGVVVAHPSAAVDGKSMMGSQDAEGRYFVREMVETAKAKGKGYATYIYAKPGTKDEAEKLSFVKHYKPWDLLIGTGVYLDDLAVERWNAVRQAAIATLLLIAALGGFAVWIARGIVRPLGGLRAAMLDLAEGRDVKAALDTGRKDEIGEMAAAVDVFRDNARSRAALEDRARSDEASRTVHQQRIEHAIAEFRSSVGSVLAAVDASMQRLGATANSLTAVADQASSQAASAAGASEQAAGNVQGVASAAEELGSSVDEIGRQVSQANTIVGQATEMATRSNTQVAALAEAAQKIGDVVGLIRAIAEQTNLLALNATIEAARAGEAGKGFAVVASEVKALASQTAKATEEIGAQVTGIQSSTKEAVAAIGQIAGTMDEISRFTSVIAAAVEEQGAATREISRNVALAADGTTTLADNISQVTTAIGETSRSAQDVLGSSDELSNAARRLQGSVDSFLSEVAA